MSVESPCVKIACVDDLSIDDRAKYERLAAAYRRSRWWGTDAEADAAAFSDLRAQLWRSQDHHGNPVTVQSKPE